MAGALEVLRGRGLLVEEAVVAGAGATKNHMLGCSLSAVAVHPVPLKKQALQHCSSLTVLAKPLHDATAWHA